MLIKNMLLALIKKRKVLFISMVFISAFSVALGTGFLSSYQNYCNYTQEYVEKYGVPDVSLEFNSAIPNSQIKAPLESVEGIEKYETNLEVLTTTKINGRTVHLDMITHEEDSFIKFYIKDNKVSYDENYCNISVSDEFCANNHISVGDKISVSALGKTVTANVTSIVSSPMIASFSLEYVLPVDKFDYGFSYITKAELEKIVGTSPILDTTNYIIIKTLSGYSNKDVLNKCKTALNPTLSKFHVTIDYTSTKESSSAIGYINSCKDELWTICFLVPVVFVVVTLILIFLFMFQIIRGMSKEIGIMNALGVSKKAILGLIVAFAIVMGIVSSIVGLGIGAGVTAIFFNVCKSVFSLPIGFGVLDVSVSFIFVGIILAISLLAGVLTLISIRKISPIKAMSNGADTYKPLPKFVEKMTRKSSINTKLTINSIHQSLLRFAISVVTVFLIYTIVSASINYHTSVDYAINQTHSAMNYQAQIYNLEDNVSVDIFYSDVSNLTTVTRAEPVLIASTNIKSATKSRNLRTFGMTSDHQFIDLPAPNGGKCEIKDNYIALETVIADSLKVKEGDVITINNMPLTVSIYKLSAIKYAYLSLPTMKKMLEDNPNIANISCCFVNLIDSSVENAFLDEISSNIKYNFHTVFVDKYLSTNFDGFLAIRLASEILIGFSIVIGLIVISLMNQASLFEQLRKFSIMRTLGFKVKDVSKNLMLQELVYFIIGIVIAIPCSIPIAKFVLSIGDPENTTLFLMYYWWVYLLSIVLIVLFIAIAHLISLISIKKWNIVDNIKTRE